jgi:hypothetical protein
MTTKMSCVQVGSGSGSGYIFQDYGSKDKDPKENKYGSATMVFRVEITASKHLKRVIGKFLTYV